MKKVVIAWLCLIAAAHAQNMPASYRAADGSFQSVSVTSGLDSAGSPIVSSYKGMDNRWHPTIVSVQTCGLDAASHPIACPASAPMSALSSYLAKTDIGAASGVAGLDENANITAPLKSRAAWLGDWTQNASSVDDYSRGRESALFGGVTAVGQNYMPQSVFIQTDPYGPYAPGCGLGVAMTGSVYSSQFPVSEADPRAGASSVVTAGQDTVANCTLVSNIPARLILTAIGYTSTTVALSQPLTADQVAQIHPNMYIVTNSPNPALTLTTTTGDLSPRNLFSGFVSTVPKVGDTQINVYAWDVSGYGTGAANQVPQVEKLDTTWTDYPLPTVFLGGGAAASAFAHNWFYAVNAADLTPSATNRSLIHQLTPLEVDLDVQGGAAPTNSINWQGISMNAGNQPSALTEDSRQLFLGGNINHHLVINGGCGNWDYESTANGAVYIPTPCGISSSTPAQESQEWGQFISGANTVRTVLWNQLGNTTAPVGWQQDVVHLGPTVDGTPTQTGAPGGSTQGDIEWNQDGNYGGISLCGYGINCDFTVGGSGQTTLRPNGLNGGDNGLVIGTQPGGYVAMVGAYAQPGYTNNLVDIEVGGVSKFLVGSDGSGRFSGSLTAATYHENLTTPASSSAPCNAGDFADDANYHYVCVATNTWKRVALSSF